tara:strand:- start:829 stop:1599 length:771 start_codon:yes stop_codon:yes gene_type:complete
MSLLNLPHPATESIKTEEYIGRITVREDSIVTFADEEHAPEFPFGGFGAGELIKMELAIGWNLIGSPFPFHQDMQATFEQAFGDPRDFIELVKDNLGNVYFPEFFFNAIGDFDPGTGYQLKTFGPVTARLPLLGTNEQVFNNIPTQNRQQFYHDKLQSITVDLTTGWNLIAFPRTRPMDAVFAFDNATMNNGNDAYPANNLLIVKNDQGDVYWPEYGYNGIGDLLPGKGYQIKTTNAVNAFSFPTQTFEDNPLINI